ncbi:sensor domain-containing diguanylate cyclase [Marinobacter fonticola]|uniref:sensor domain-containing diguanylate cyclase n=1 Tax=Marinobacter fonticola TaxID=2603215 RepID=UPI0011E61D3D|nr:diguanylate cyclase [Marinobacter fonticola]
MATVSKSALRRILVHGWPVLLVFALGITLTLVLARRAAETEAQLAHSRFEQSARARIALVKELIQGQLRELDALRRFITLGPELTRQDFQALARLSDRIQMTVAWNQNVPSTELDQYRARMRENYGDNFRLRLPESVEPLGSGDIRRYFPITYHKSSVPGADLIGIDTGYLPSRIAAYEQAMSTGEAVMIGGVRTLDDPGDQTGILVFSPVFEGDAGNDITERHFGNLRGFVAMSLRLNALADLASEAHGGGPGIELLFSPFPSDSSDDMPADVADLLSRHKRVFTDELELADGIVSVHAVPLQRDDWQPRPIGLVIAIVGVAGAFLGAAYLALVILQRSRAEQMVASRTKELKSALDALSESEARWQFALAGSGDGVWDRNMETGEVFYSEAWKAMLGYASDEIGNGLSEWTSRIHPDDLAGCRHALETHFRGESQYYEHVHRIRCKAGHYKWILDRGKVVEWLAPGRPARVIGTHSDITHVKQTELELVEANAFLSNLLSSAENMSIVATDSRGVIRLFNSGAERLLGYASEDMIGQQTLEYFHDAKELSAQRQALAKDNEAGLEGVAIFQACIDAGAQSQRWTYHCKNGQERQVQQTLSVMRDNEGKRLGYLSIALDMTDYLKAVDALEQSDRLLQDLTANVPGAIYQMVVRPDHSFFFPYVSDGVRQVYGLTPEETREDGARLLQRIHPDEVDGFRRSVQRSRETLLPWMREFKVSVPGQAEKWLRGEATPRRLDDGSTLWHGYVSDVTEIKQLEMQLRKQATIDPLTGTFNRRHLETHWQREIARVQRKGMPFSLIMLDIDHFKLVNDTYGHDIGDEALIRLGRMLRKEVRSTDVVYRLGGEEFLVLCEDTDVDGATRLADMLLDRLRHLPMPFEKWITASMSVIEVVADDDMPTAFKRLDELLYEAKASGRDQVVSEPVKPVV